MTINPRILCLAMPMMFSFPQIAQARRMSIPLFIPTSGPFFYILVGVGVLAILFKVAGALSGGAAQAAAHLPRKLASASGEVGPTTDMARIDQMIAMRAHEIQASGNARPTFSQTNGTFGRRAKG